MSDDLLEPLLVPPCKVVYSSYEGPRRGLGRATKLLYSWVGTYFADRVGDVTVCFSDRGSFDAAGDAPVEVEARFVVDEPFSEKTRLPDGLEIKKVPGEVVLSTFYRGPLTGLKAAVRPWLKAVADGKPLEPGYRQRMITIADSPQSPDWEIEVAVVLS